MPRHLSSLLERRTFLKLAGLSATAQLGLAAPAKRASSFTYGSLAQTIEARSKVADGYDEQVLIRWGDPVVPGAPDFDPANQSARDQRRQFGFNCDYVAFMPSPRGSNSSDRGILWTNHEYAKASMMAKLEGQAMSDLTQAATGGSLVEVRRGDYGWWVVEDSPFNRRIDVNTPVAFGGPAKESAKLHLDAKGMAACGTLANCAGGKTPWGTVLTAEENFNFSFGNGPADYEPKVPGDVDIRFSSNWTGKGGWSQHDPRFDLAKNPDEPMRYGWVVEIDPHEPDRPPVKRTALGRFKHEGATTIVSGGQVVVYMGDDQGDMFLFRFVSEKVADPTDPVACRDLLDRGVLSVARFGEETLEWVSLVAGEGELAGHEQLKTQADVCLNPRLAALAVNATPMDRPEDVEANPGNGNVYVALTNNSRRKVANAPNKRAPNYHGHILELVPPGGDHTADEFAWDALLFGGKPGEHEGAESHPDSEVWLSCPDNVAFDPKGRLWISTDQGGSQSRNGIPDGAYTCDLSGDGRALLKLFYRAPIGAEVCGPEFTPDGSTLFLAIQHPGDGSSLDNPSTRWPDFREGVPPRPSVVALTYEDARREVLGE